MKRSWMEPAIESATEEASEYNYTGPGRAGPRSRSQEEFANSVNKKARKDGLILREPMEEVSHYSDRINRRVI